MSTHSLEISNPELARWLTQLHTSIWRNMVYDTKFGYVDGMTEKRQLSQEEWDKVKKVISSEEVILTLHDSMGFVLHVSIWSFPVSVFEDEPVHLLTISNSHIEGMGAGLNSDGGLWSVVYPYTHSDSNKGNVRSFLSGQCIRERDEYAY